MAKRTFKFVSLVAGGTPQPVFGTTTSAIVNPSQTQVSIPVVDSSWFKVGDYIKLDPAGTNPEQLIVQNIPDSTHIKVPFVNFKHSSGVYVQLDIVCFSVFIAAKIGNAAAINIGTQYNMVFATGVFTIVAINGGQNFEDNNYGFGNGFNSSDYWFDGTTGDNILPSLSII